MQAPIVDCDVLIVGAGPTGLAMANELTRHGVRYRIIDAAPTPTTTSKALGVQARTLELFEKLDLAARAVEQGTQVYGANIFSERKRIVNVNFTRKIASHYAYVLMLPQDHTERLLTERLLEQGVTIEREVRLESFTRRETGVEAVLRHKDGSQERVLTGWLMGCDGPHSIVRHMLGLKFAGNTFEQSFVLADVCLDNWPLPPDRVAVFIHHGDLIGSFPLPGGQHRVIIAYKPGEAPQDEVTLEEVQRAIDLCGPAGVRAHDPVWLSRFHIHQRKVRRYARDRVFLLGDAAHIHSPIAAQGMNTGIQDVFNLAWKFALVIHGRARPELLASYNAEREPVGRALLLGTDLGSRIAFLHHPVSAGLRDRIASLVSRLPFAQKRFARTVSQTTINYRRSPIVRDYRGNQGLPLARLLKSEQGPCAGDRAPDALVSVDQGKEYIRLFDLLRGTKHTLLIFSDHRTGQTAEILSLLANDYSDVVDAYQVTSHREVQQEGEHMRVIYDPDGALHRTYGIDNTGLVLIRPDGYIGLYSQPLEIGHLQGYLAGVFLPLAREALREVAL